MIIFSYGSNMSLKRLKDRVPSSVKLCNAFIEKYSLRIHKTSKDGSSKANILFTGNESDIVWGVIFEINKEEKKALDRAEGLGYGYNEKELIFTNEIGEQIKAIAYIADEKAIDDSLLPYHWYKNFITTGANENNLPKNYLLELKAIESIEDNDKERNKLNSDLLK